MCVSLPTHLCTQETKSKSLLSLISFTGTNSGILAEVYTHAPKENFIEGLNYISTTQKALAFPQFIPNKNVFFVKFAKTPFTILLRFPHGGHVSIESHTSFLRTFTNTGSIARSSWRRCTANKPRVKRWTTKARQRSNWQRTHVVTSACRLHFLNLSLPPFHSTMEHIWERNSVTLDVICRLLLPRLSLPPFLCILPPPSFSVYIWSQLQHPSLSLFLCLWNKGSTEELHCFEELHFLIHLFLLPSKHCLYFIKYGLGTYTCTLNMRHVPRCTEHHLLDGRNEVN